MLKSQQAGGVFTITLDRPDRGNALSVEMVERLIAAVGEATTQPDIHTLLLRGSGKHFCTGFDLADLDASGDGELLLRLVRIETLLAMLWHAPVRTVGVAMGRTWGAGADLLVACDDRIAVAGASFRFPGAAFGIVLGTRRLTERVGVDRAREVVTNGRQLDTAAALASGLASEICGAEELDRRLQLHGQPPAVDRETVQQLRAATRPDQRDADLATLVRSAARPGLKARLVAYRQAQLDARARPAK